MKHAALVAVLGLLTIAACDKKSEEQSINAPATLPLSALPPGHPPVAPSNHPPIDTSPDTESSGDRPDIKLTETATVLNTVDVPQFTYLEVRQGKQTRWLAAASIAAKKGDVIQFDKGETIEYFDSKALMRTFPNITFVNRVKIIKAK